MAVFRTGLLLTLGVACRGACVPREGGRCWCSSLLARRGLVVHGCIPQAAVAVGPPARTHTRGIQRASGAAACISPGGHDMAYVWVMPAKDRHRLLCTAHVAH